MTRLILTGCLIPEFTKSHFADIAVYPFFRSVWGPLPSPDELANLLDGLAHGPTPAVAGLDNELRFISRENLGARLLAYHRSRLSLTDPARRLLRTRQTSAGIVRLIAGGAAPESNNDRLWRWNPALIKP
jgi:hypothetical protein